MRDLGISTKSSQKVLEGRKQVDECVITSTDISDALRDLDVMGIYI